MWAENAFVVKANLMHERVHDPNRVLYSKTKKVLHAVSVFNDEYDLYGVVDCIEIYKAQEENKEAPSVYTIVEHKPHKPKYDDFNEDDVLQVFAQKICVDSVFKTKSKGIIYYSNEKKRVELPFETNYGQYESALKATINEMRLYLSKNQIPAIQKGQKCSGCSFEDLCMPKIKRSKPVKEAIYNMIEGEI